MNEFQSFLVYLKQMLIVSGLLYIYDSLGMDTSYLFYYISITSASKMKSEFMSKILPHVESSSQIQKNQRFEIHEVLTQCGFQIQPEYSVQQIAKMIQAVEQMSQKPIKEFIDKQLQHDKDAHESQLQQIQDQHQRIYIDQKKQQNYLQNFKVSQYNKQQNFVTNMTPILYQILQKQLHCISLIQQHMQELEAALSKIELLKKENTFDNIEKIISTALKSQTPVERIACMSRDDLVINKYMKVFQQQYEKLTIAAQPTQSIQQKKQEQKQDNFQNITIPQPTFYESPEIMRKQLEVYSQQLEQNMQILNQQQQLVNETYKQNNKGVSSDYYQLLQEHLIDNYNFLRVFDRLTHEVKQKINPMEYSATNQEPISNNIISSPNSYYREMQQKQKKHHHQSKRMVESQSDIDQMGLFLKGE